ncbi:peptidoglycan-binding protein [Planctomycetota bacterium]
MSGIGIGATGTEGRGPLDEIGRTEAAETGENASGEMAHDHAGRLAERPGIFHSGSLAASAIMARVAGSLAARDEVGFDPETMPVLEKGMNDNDDVNTLQGAINKWRSRMGKRPIGTDGDFGGGTRTALKEFQVSNGLPATGTADRETWQALARMIPEQSPVSEVRPQGREPSFKAAEMPAIKSGSKDHDSIETLQNALNVWRATRNQPAIGVDKDFGWTTRAAVKHFQALNGLPANGEVDQATWAKLAEVESRDLSSTQAPVEVDVPWISQFDRGGRVDSPGNTACFRASWAMINEFMANKGIQATMGAAADRIDVGTRESPTGEVWTNATKANAGRSYVDRVLDKGLPVMVGISHVAGSSYNRNAVTDHYVLITGRGRDDEGNLYYTFADPSVGNEEAGRGKFYLDQDSNFVKAGRSARGLVYDRRWEVSEIRTWKEIP